MLYFGNSLLLFDFFEPVEDIESATERKSVIERGLTGLSSSDIGLLIEPTDILNEFLCGNGALLTGVMVSETSSGA